MKYWEPSFSVQLQRLKSSANKVDEKSRSEHSVEHNTSISVKNINPIRESKLFA